MFVETLRESDFEFSILCFQECWLNENFDLSMIHLQGYTCIFQGRTCSNKGGLILYLNDKYEYKPVLNYNSSNLWEGHFLEIHGGGLKKHIIIGNIYRPPRELIDNYKAFFDEFFPVLRSLHSSRSEFLLTGDFNINLLKINDREVINDFFDLLSSHSFFPTITLPTRFSERTGTLIDNFFCKLSYTTLNSTSGVL